MAGRRSLAEIEINTEQVAHLLGGGKRIFVQATQPSLAVGDVWIDTSTSPGGGGGTTTFATTITGDGTATAFTVTHSKGTRDVEVQVYRNVSPWDRVQVRDERSTINDVIVRFDTPPANGVAFRVVVRP